MKKIICILLSVSLAVFPVLPVFAEEPGDVGKSFVKLKYVLTQLGCVFSGDLDTMISNSEKFQQFEDGNIPVVDDGKGSVTIDNSTVNNIYNAAKEEVTKLNGYYYIATEYNLDNVYSLLKDVNYSTFLRGKNELVNNRSGFMCRYSSADKYVNFFYSPTNGPVEIYLSGNRVLAVGSDFEVVPFEVYYFREQNPLGIEPYLRNAELSKETLFELYSGYPVKLFYSLQDLKNYKLSGGKVYLTSNFNNYKVVNDNSITYKGDVINNTNWNEVNNNIYNNIYNNYQSTSDDEKQDMIDLKYDEIISALGDIGGSVDDMNKTLSRWLERIYKKVDGIYKKIDNFKVGEIPQEVIKNISDMLERLERMHQQLLFVVENLSVINGKFNDLLTNLGTLPDLLTEKFETLTKAVENIKVSGGGLGGFLGNALGNLLGDLLDKIINGGEEAVADAVEELATTFAPMVDVSKTKFPFSIPWDFQKIIVLLAADPEVPKLEIPFSLPNYGFKQNIDIDLSSFEGVSKISRSFFTVMFVISLMSITIKLMGKGGE